MELSAWRPRARKLPELSLETVLTDPQYFGLTSASSLQRAICRATDGMPLGELAEREEVQLAFGGVDALAKLPIGVRPLELLLFAGIRCGKSFLAGACGVRSALTCDVSRCSAGDIPRVSILSISLDIADQTWMHVVGNIRKSPRLSALLLEEPTADSLLLRHPTGRPIEIKIVAGARAASSLVARWSAGIILDEAPRMFGAGDGVVNLDHARTFSVGRLLDGAQLLMIGSPFAPFGPAYQLLTEHFGRPSRGLVVVRAKAHWMNPRHWTPERRAELKRVNPDAHSVDVECNFLDPAGSMFTLAELELATRKAPVDVPADDRFSYTAAIDPATRGNGWALVVATNLGLVDVEIADGVIEKRERYAVVLSEQWVGSKMQPLDPRETFRKIAELLRPYRIKSLVTDQWSIDTLRPLASDAGLGLVEETLTAPRKYELFEAVRTRIVDKTLELPPNQVLLRDLASVQKIVRQQTLAVDVPVGSDGRHADYAIALALALSRPLFPPRAVAPTPEEEAHQTHLKARENARKAAEKRANARWNDPYD